MTIIATVYRFLNIKNVRCPNKNFCILSFKFISGLNKKFKNHLVVKS